MNWKYRTVAEMRETAKQRAIDWLTDRYAVDRSHLDAIPIIWGKAGSRFYKGIAGSKNASRRGPHIKIGMPKTKAWWTYRRKTIGVAAEGIVLPTMLRATLSLIHEYTHVIQHHDGRCMSEVETTKNELDYVREVAPYFLLKLTNI